MSNVNNVPLSLLATWIKNNYKVDGVIVLTVDEDDHCMVQLNSIGLDDHRIQDVLAQAIYLNRKSATEEHLIG